MRSIGELLRQAKARLSATSASASLDVQLLMAHVLDADRAHVIAHPERVLSEDEQARFDSLVVRRAAGEPIAYIFGRRAFYDLELTVSPAVLIPRPETELLVELAIEFARARGEACAAADIGTGSGAIAVTFAAHVPLAKVYAVDVSEAALAVARLNAERSGTAVEFLHGDLLEPLIRLGITVDLLLANLPYIATGELRELEVSRHEPWTALDGGPDGLDLIRRTMREAPRVLRPGAQVLLEIGADQGKAAAGIVRVALPSAQVDVLQDLAGLDRIVRALTPPNRE